MPNFYKQVQALDKFLANLHIMNTVPKAKTVCARCFMSFTVKSASYNGNRFCYRRCDPKQPPPYLSTTILTYSIIL